jgi:hypothetical protein
MGQFLEGAGIVWLSTYHPSRQALQTPDPVERELRVAAGDLAGLF